MSDTNPTPTPLFYFFQAKTQEAHAHPHARPLKCPRVQKRSLMQNASSPPASPPPSIYCPETKTKRGIISPPWPFFFFPFFLSFFLSVPPSYIPKQSLEGEKKTNNVFLRGFNSIHLNLIKVRGNKLIAESILALFFQPLIPINIAWHHRPCCAQASWGVRLRLFTTHTHTHTHTHKHKGHTHTHTHTHTLTDRHTSGEW